VSWERRWRVWSRILISCEDSVGALVSCGGNVGILGGGLMWSVYGGFDQCSETTVEERVYIRPY